MKNNKRGQALVVLLVFMVVAIIITTMAIAIVIINATAATNLEQGEMALKIAESGTENALLRLVRDPFYNGTETLSIGNGVSIATVSGGNPYIITTSGSFGSFVRKISAAAHSTNAIFYLDSWVEVY